MDTGYRYPGTLKQVGCPEFAVYQQKVMERAQVLLATTGLSVTEVAYAPGFERPQSLSKLFRNKTNLTPTV